MVNRVEPAGHALSIAMVERETGVSKDTLRVWERRYGFPAPTRSASGERLYPVAQVERLRIVKRLLDSGHRPGRTVGLDLAELQTLSDARAATDVSTAVPSAHVLKCMALVHSNDVEGLRDRLSQALVTHGLVRSLTELIAPLNVAIGDSWMRGEIAVFQEHAYSQTVAAVLRAAIEQIPQSRSRGAPRVMLTTLAHEAHGLGLLMAEAILALEGCSCLSLGTQTPVADIRAAAQIHAIHVVALSFTGVIGARQMVEGLAQLRQDLPPSIEIWAGGQFAMLHRRHLRSATVIGTLEDVRHQVSLWRQVRAGDS